MSVQVTIADICKRQRCQSVSNESSNFADIGGLFYEAYKMISDERLLSGNKLTVKESTILQDLIYKLESPQAADAYYEESLSLIENLCSKNTTAAKFFAEKFCSDVIPYVMNLEALGYSVQKNYPEISPTITNNIIEAVNKQAIICRILTNHNSINEKFGIEEAISKIINKDISVIAETCAYYIDQYNIDPYKKFNIAIEEMCYFSAVNNPEMFAKSINYLKEYFLLSNSMNERELSRMKKVIKESYVIPDEIKVKMLNKSEFVHEKVTLFSPDRSTNEMIKNVKTASQRNDKDLKSILDNFLEKNDILRGLEEFLIFIFKATICGTFVVADKDAITIAKDALLYITDKIKCMVTDEIYNRPLLSREELNVIVSIYLSLEDEIRQRYVVTETPFTEESARFCEILRMCSDSLIDSRDIALPKYKMQEDLSSDKTYTEAEYNTYRFNRLLSIAETLSGSLDGSIFDKNNKDMYSYMGEDNKIDITLSQDPINGEEDDDYIEAEAEAVKFCKYANENLQINGESDTIKVYYEMVGNIVEYHLIETATIIIDEENLEEYAEAMDNSMDLYLEMFDQLEDLADILEQNEEIKNELLESFVESFETEAIAEANKPKKDIKIDSDLKDPAAEKKSGFSFNNLKLAIMGLRGKMKKMGQKEREASRTLDNYSKLFVKSLQKALISDRREAIIKGSVIPSFSKLLKIAGGLILLGGGVGAVAGASTGLAVAAITALGGFAVSKNLTKKERTLLLDEIEIELEIIDKEIARADSKDQIKKMRVLMRQKKELQRQYQRIRYNIRVGKDILPGSGVGIPARE